MLLNMREHLSACVECLLADVRENFAHTWGEHQLQRSQGTLTRHTQLNLETKRTAVTLAGHGGPRAQAEIGGHEGL